MPSNFKIIDRTGFTGFAVIVSTLLRVSNSSAFTSAFSERDYINTTSIFDF